MRSIWLIVMALAACDSGTPTCKSAVTKARSADKAMAFDAAARLVGTCELEDWSMATRQCIAHATSRLDLDACTASLSPVHTRMLEALATMTRFKDRMCQCTTTFCAQRVNVEMTQWARDEARDQHEPAKLSEQETKKLADVGEQLAKCMETAMLVPDQASPEGETSPFGSGV
jgi:hypothetical protein